jgi:formylglycine-generating enzyme
LPDGYRFSLPTETQWEYASRAKTVSRNYGGDKPSDTLNIAWCRENSNNVTHEVGLKKPNQWRFKDMFGNVVEWCFDTVDYYPTGKVVDWIVEGNVEDEEESKIYRGGGYCDESDYEIFDSAYRGYLSSGDRFDWCGFRLCLRS